MRALAVLAIVLMLVGCGSSRRAGEVQTQGFLGDYSMLTPGAEGQAVLRYVNPGPDWAKYDKVLVDPVTVWKSARTGDIPEADLQTAANFLYAQLRQELGKDFTLVDAPGPDTLRVTAALTDAEPANQTMVVVSNVVPSRSRPRAPTSMSRASRRGRARRRPRRRSRTRRPASCCPRRSTGGWAVARWPRPRRPGPM